jgi:hypothetical protein
MDRITTSTRTAVLLLDIGRSLHIDVGNYIQTFEDELYGTVQVRSLLLSLPMSSRHVMVWLVDQQDLLDDSEWHGFNGGHFRHPVPTKVLAKLKHSVASVQARYTPSSHNKQQQHQASSLSSSSSSVATSVTTATTSQSTSTSPLSPTPLMGRGAVVASVGVASVSLSDVSSNGVVVPPLLRVLSPSTSSGNVTPSSGSGGSSPATPSHSSITTSSSATFATASSSTSTGGSSGGNGIAITLMKRPGLDRVRSVETKAPLTTIVHAHMGGERDRTSPSAGILATPVVPVTTPPTAPLSRSVSSNSAYDEQQQHHDDLQASNGINNSDANHLSPRRDEHHQANNYQLSQQHHNQLLQQQQRRHRLGEVVRHQSNAMDEAFAIEQLKLNKQRIDTTARDSTRDNNTVITPNGIPAIRTIPSPPPLIHHPAALPTTVPSVAFVPVMTPSTTVSAPLLVVDDGDGPASSTPLLHPQPLHHHQHHLHAPVAGLTMSPPASPGPHPIITLVTPSSSDHNSGTPASSGGHGHSHGHGVPHIVTAPISAPHLRHHRHRSRSSSHGSSRSISPPHRTASEGPPQRALEATILDPPPHLHHLNPVHQLQLHEKAPTTPPTITVTSGMIGTSTPPRVSSPLTSPPLMHRAHTMWASPAVTSISTLSSSGNNNGPPSYSSLTLNPRSSRAVGAMSTTTTTSTKNGSTIDSITLGHRDPLAVLGAGALFTAYFPAIAGSSGRSPTPAAKQEIFVFYSPNEPLHPISPVSPVPITSMDDSSLERGSLATLGKGVRGVSVRRGTTVAGTSSTPPPPSSSISTISSSTTTISIPPTTTPAPTTSARTSLVGCLYWCLANGRRVESHDRCILMREIGSLVLGKQCKAFQTSIASDAVPDYCFSIMSRSRQIPTTAGTPPRETTRALLNLEANSVQERSVWVMAISDIIWSVTGRNNNNVSSGNSSNNATATNLSSSTKKKANRDESRWTINLAHSMHVLGQLGMPRNYIANNNRQTQVITSPSQVQPQQLVQKATTGGQPNQYSTNTSIFVGASSGTLTIPTLPPPPQRPQSSWSEVMASHSLVAGAQLARDQVHQVMSRVPLPLITPRLSRHEAIALLTLGGDFNGYFENNQRTIAGQPPPQNPIIQELFCFYQQGPPPSVPTQGTQPPSLPVLLHSISQSSATASATAAASASVPPSHWGGERDYGCLYWCLRGHRVLLPECCLPLSEIDNIYLGKQSKVLQLPGAAKAVRERCFTLVSRDPPVHISFEGENGLQVTAWLAAINCILVACQRDQAERERAYHQHQNQLQQQQAPAVPPITVVASTTTNSSASSSIQHGTLQSPSASPILFSASPPITPSSGGNGNASGSPPASTIPPLDAPVNTGTVMVSPTLRAAAAPPPSSLVPTLSSTALITTAATSSGLITSIAPGSTLLRHATEGIPIVLSNMYPPPPPPPYPPPPLASHTLAMRRITPPINGGPIIFGSNSSPPATPSSASKAASSSPVLLSSHAQQATSSAASTANTVAAAITTPLSLPASAIGTRNEGKEERSLNFKAELPLSTSLSSSSSSSSLSSSLSLAAPPSTFTSEEDPTTLFDVICKIGAGTFATVYKAQSKHDGKFVAVKIIDVNSCHLFCAIVPYFNSLLCQ